MKPKLISRHKFPPGGWQFLQAETGWSAPAPMSDNFAVTVGKIIAHRKGNPRFNLPTDVNTVSETLDTYTCFRLRFDPLFVDTEEAQKKTASLPSLPRNTQAGVVARLVEKVANVANGGVILADWVGHGGVPVNAEIAQARSNTCLSCPMNNLKSSWFFEMTKDVAEAIKQQVELKNHLGLHVENEDKLGFCDACDCPLSLKPWVPIDFIRKHTSAEQMENFWHGCWIKP